MIHRYVKEELKGMSLQVENLEKNMAKLTIEVPAEQFSAAIKAAFDRNKNQFNIPGFRRGKAPLAMVEKMYGVEFLYEEAANIVLEDTYPDAEKESGLEIVSSPDVDIVQIEKGMPFIYTATVALKPEVTLGEYKGIEVKKADAQVTDEDVEAELKRVQDQNSRLVSVEDRPVADGDQAVIDFEGFVDGEPFEGGKGENFPLTIGSHSFVDNFEEQLIGKNPGDECEVNVTFPENYQKKDLAGKPALFKVKIKEIKVKELPELDDEFAGEVSDFETLEDYKKDVKAKLSETRGRQAAAENENRVVAAVIANASLEIPQSMIDDEVRSIVNDYAYRLHNQGVNFEQYLKYIGLTTEEFSEQCKPQAEQQLRTRLVMEAVAKAENIEPDEEAVEHEISTIASSYKTEPDELKKQLGERGMKSLKENLAVQEAIDFVVAEAKLV